MCNCHCLCYILPVLSQLYNHTVHTDSHAAEFVNFYTKEFKFLWNVLSENDSPYEELTNFIHS